MNPTDLLPEMCLLPPPLATSWVGAATTRITETPDGQRADPWPLFWYDPPWHEVDPVVAQRIAVAVDALRIPVALLGRDLGLEELSTARLQFVMIPYRPDRYGLAVSDLQTADTIDMRLARVRNELGRYAYAPAQIQRWLDRDAEELAAAIPAPGWPAELTRISQLAGKFQQLRILNEHARCAVSISPYRLPEELPGIIAAGPDAVILRMDDSDEIVGNHLARIVANAKAIIDAAAEQPDQAVRLWLVLPYEPTPTDCAKLFALGASAIAIDWWCQPLIRMALDNAERGRSLPVDTFAIRAEEFLKPRMNRLAGLTSSYGLARPSELDRSYLGTTDHGLAEQIGLTPI